MFVHKSMSQEGNWLGTSSNWSDPGSWSTAVPNNTQSAVVFNSVNNSSGIFVTLDTNGNTTVGRFENNYLRFFQRIIVANYNMNSLAGSLSTHPRGFKWNLADHLS